MEHTYTGEILMQIGLKSMKKWMSYLYVQIEYLSRAQNEKVPGNYFFKLSLKFIVYISKILCESFVWGPC